MIRKMFLMTMFLAFLVLAMSGAASAQPRIVGVNVGDWFKYGNAVVYWYTNDTSATMPEYLEDFNETEWMTGTITNVLGTNITVQTLTHFKNGTEEISSGHVDIDTGEGNMTMWIISADLGVNDSLYSAGYYSEWRINETIPRTYPDGPRQTNHINITTEFAMDFPFLIIYNMSLDYYWDRSIGVAVEMSSEFLNRTGDYFTSWSYFYEIIDSNRWVVPEFPTMATILILAITITFAIAIRKRRLLKTSIR